MTVKIITKEQAIVAKVKRLAAMGLKLTGIANALNNLGPKFAWGGDFSGGGDFTGEANKWNKYKVMEFMDDNYLAHDPDIDRKEVNKRIGALLDTGLSNSEVAEVMNRLGYLTTNGKPFKGSSVKYLSGKVGLNDE